MSLTIYFEGIDKFPQSSVVRDVESFFMSVKLDGCDYDRHIIETIERGVYVSNTVFVDRFGVQLRRDCLSTGVKVALSLYHLPDMLFWGIEMGRNALAEVVKRCTVGNLLLEASTYYIEDDIEDTKIDVICRDRHYSSLHKFSEYMIGDAPYDS